MSLSGYECPTCEEYPPEGERYYITSRGKHRFTGEDSEKKTPNGTKIYPIYSDVSRGHWEYGGSSWEETHKCPNCKTEFSFSNSDV